MNKPGRCLVTYLALTAAVSVGAKGGGQTPSGPQFTMLAASAPSLTIKTPGAVEVRLLWMPSFGWLPPAGVNVYKKIGTGGFAKINTNGPLQTPSNAFTGSTVIQTNTILQQLQETTTAKSSSFNQDLPANTRTSSTKVFSALKTTALALKQAGVAPQEMARTLQSSQTMQQHLAALALPTKGPATVTAGHYNIPVLRAQIVLQALAHPGLANTIGLGFTDSAATVGQAITYELVDASKDNPTLPPLATCSVTVSNAVADLGPPTPNPVDGFQLDQTTVDLHWDPLIKEINPTIDETKYGVLSYVVERQETPPLGSPGPWTQINTSPVTIGYQPRTDKTFIAPPTTYRDHKAPLDTTSYRITTVDSFGRLSTPQLFAIKLDDLRTPLSAFKVLGDTHLPNSATFIGKPTFIIKIGAATTAPPAGPVMQPSVFVLTQPFPNLNPPPNPNGTPGTIAPPTPVDPTEGPVDANIYRKLSPNLPSSPGFDKTATALGKAGPVSTSDLTVGDFCTLVGFDPYDSYRAWQYDTLRLASAQKMAKTLATNPSTTYTGYMPQETAAEKAAGVAAGTPLAAANALVLTLTAKVVADLTNWQQAVTQFYSVFGKQSAETALKQGIPSPFPLANWSKIEQMPVGFFLKGITDAGATTAWTNALAFIQEYNDASLTPDQYATYYVRTFYDKVGRESSPSATKSQPIPLLTQPNIPTGFAGAFSKDSVQFGYVTKNSTGSLGLVHESAKFNPLTNHLAKIQAMKFRDGTPVIPANSDFAIGTGFKPPSNGNLAGVATVTWQAVPQTTSMRYAVYRALNSGWVTTGTGAAATRAYHLDLTADGLPAKPFVQLGQTQALSFTDQFNRSNAVHYLYCVQAVNRWGVPSATSVTSDVAIPGTSAPSIPSVTDVIPGQLGGVKLVWDPIPADEQVTSYLILRALQSSFGTPSVSAKALIKRTGTTLTSLKTHGITPEVAIHTGLIDFTDPSLVKGRQYTLTAPQSNELDVVNYSIVATVPDVPSLAVRPPLSFLDTPTNPDVMYVYRVIGVNSDGVGSNACVPFEVQPFRVKADPVTLPQASVNPGSPMAVIVAWAAPTSSASAYLVYRSIVTLATINGKTATAPQFSTPILMKTVDYPLHQGDASISTQFTDYAVRVGQTYQYTIVTRDSAGRLSDGVAVSVGPIPPTK